MKIPHKIRINSKVSYDILWADIIDDDPETLGSSYFITKEIVLKNGMSKTQTEKTVIHEICHSIDDENKIGLTHAQIYKLE